jgi:hypothetical protein
MACFRSLVGFTPAGVHIRLQKITTRKFGAVGSLQLPCGIAALRKPSGMAPPAGEGCRTFVVLLSARMRLRNGNDAFLGEGRNRSDLRL